MSEPVETECDVLIVGSGAAGLVAAITAVHDGLKPLVIEKTGFWGGTSSMSGGGLWVPTNDFMKADGVEDNFDDALRYMDQIKDEGPATSKERKIAFLRTAPEMLRFLASKGVKLKRDKQPDYHPELPGGRIGRLVVPENFDVRQLGDLAKTQRPRTVPYALTMKDVVIVPRGTSSIYSMYVTARVVIEYMFRKMIGQDPVSSGAALVGQLMLVLKKLGVPVHLNCPMRELVVEDGRAVGVVAEVNGKRQVIRARAGVLLCAGGFAHAAEFRKAHQGITGEHSSASPDDTGDIIKMADEMGAATALLDDSWWGPCLLYPGGVPAFTVSDRSLPHTMMVNGQGKRFVNESQSYNSIGHEIIRQKPDPMWLILDNNARSKYFFGAMLPGQTPQAMLDAGFFVKADTIEELAKKCDLDPANLRATVDRFNAFADKGVDEDFHRGESAYDRAFGDPKNKPNTNLGRIDRGPFLATRMYLGDLGTKGGFVTDEHARVMRQDGSVIDGLYATGNTTASVMGRSYPGPGSTLGPATTFAYLAIHHMARRVSNQAGAAS